MERPFAGAGNSNAEYDRASLVQHMLGDTQGVPPRLRDPAPAPSEEAARPARCKDLAHPLPPPIWQSPFIVTSCHHAFCEKHTREPNFDESTCPGCRAHVSRVGGSGMRPVTYVLNECDQDVLNGTTPEVAIGVALNAVNFW